MNALVASVIRTYTPVIVGQVVGFLIMINFPVRPELTLLLMAVVGGGLTLAYYTLVRILEQQWPAFGALLGLTKTPDTYSKGDPAASSSPAASTPADGPAVAEAILSQDAAPARSFAPALAKTDILAPADPSTPIDPVEPVTVAPVLAPPTA